MVLSDAQVDRYSRQIILPQIGGSGQERLLQSSVALAGGGPLLETTALALAGAGVGRIALHARHRLSEDLGDLNPDVRVTRAHGALGDREADVLVACDATLGEVDGAARAHRPMVGGGTAPTGGWLVVAVCPEVCGACGARAAAREVREPVSGAGRDGGDAAAVPTRRPAAGRHTAASVAAGVVGSLMSLAVIKHLLGLSQPSEPEWVHFDAATLALTTRPIPRAPDCRVCGEQGRP